VEVDIEFADEDHLHILLKDKNKILVELNLIAPISLVGLLYEGF